MLMGLVLKSPVLAALEENPVENPVEKPVEKPVLAAPVEKPVAGGALVVEPPIWSPSRGASHAKHGHGIVHTSGSRNTAEKRRDHRHQQGIYANASKDCVKGGQEGVA